LVTCWAQEATMKEFKNKVAVITGAASGIGRALAERCAEEGMRVVLADIEASTLASTEAQMKAAGATVRGVVTDVTRADDVAALARKTVDAFGAVHLLCNNAGVGAGTTIWQSTLRDWQWVLGVNLWGVIHGVHSFVPIMLQQDTDCHIINTASIAGLISGPGLGVYKVSKHGVVSLSETLYCELAEAGAKIKVSVLCPGFVDTRIMDSDRNRPAELQDPSDAEAWTPDMEAEVAAVRRAVAAGISTRQVADAVFDVVRENRFYILTHPELKSWVQTRLEAILQDRDPARPTR
jgi:NAD(P)-dependent dehydrogenase (short-subunit alcohol dehydrogenase family)